MISRTLAVLLCLAAGRALAADAPVATPAPTPTQAASVDGWEIKGPGASSYEVALDDAVKRSERPTVRFVQAPDVRALGTLVKEAPADAYRGKRVRFSAWLKGENIVAGAQVWMAVVGADRPLVSGRVRERATGSFDWQRREIALAVPAEAHHISVGILLGGGRVWLDDAHFEAATDETATLEWKPAANLGFEASESGVPASWFRAGSHPDEYEMSVDSAVHREGKRSAVIRSTTSSPHGFGTLMQTADATEHRGRRVRLSAVIKAEAVDRWAGLWFRVDAPFDPAARPQSLAFDNMGDRPINGTSDWTRYECVLDVPAGADTLNFGVLLTGTGVLWVDDLHFETVGPDVPVTGRR